MAGLFAALPGLHRSLDYHTERHNVLASNLANVDTPGFRARELVRPEEAAPGGAAPVALARSHAAHLPLGEDRAGVPGRVEDDASAQVGADGNSVSLDREMAKLAANDLRYETVTTLVRSYFGGLRYAATDFQG